MLPCLVDEDVATGYQETLEYGICDQCGRYGPVIVLERIEGNIRTYERALCLRCAEQ